METVTQALNWVTVHKGEIVQIITGLIAVATIIVKLTPTQKDDTFLGKVIGFIGKYIALNKGDVTIKAEEKK